MLLPLLFILFAAAAAIDEKDECRSKVWLKCDIEKVPEKIPDTMEDLKRDCEVVRDIIKCTEEENEKCKEKAFDSTALRKLIQFMETNCDEDSSLYQALSRNYECILPVAKNIRDNCRPSTEVLEVLENLVSQAGELSLTARACDRSLYEITCTAHIVGVHCGPEAKETVTKILQNLNWEFRDCNEEAILTELQPLQELIDSTFTEALVVENAILEEVKKTLAK